MTVQELTTALNLNVFHLADGTAPLKGGYIGDLLSWVIGRAQEGQVWMTIMSNQNVAAVALMTDVACVLLTEGVKPDPDLLTRCQQQGINLLGSPLSTFQVAAQLDAFF